MSISSFIRKMLGRPEPWAPKSQWSADDWCPGELAVSLTDVWEECETGEVPTRFPRTGEVRRVADVVLYGASKCLVLESYPNQSWSACSFRKAEIDEAEACEPEFAALLKRKKVRA